MRKTSLAVIFVEYDHEKYGDLFQKLKEYLKRITDCRITYIRVDNKHEDKEATLIEEGIYKVGGNNIYREFSGWQKGIETIHFLNIDCDVILFINDAFLKPGESFLKDYADVALLRESLDKDAIIGRIDTLGRKFIVYGYDVSKWICTNCFVVPKSAVDKIRDIVSIKNNIKDFFCDDYSAHHLLVDKEITSSDMEAGYFELEAISNYSGLSDLRIVLDKSFVPRQFGMPDDSRELSIHLMEFAIAGQVCHPENMIKGFYDYPEDKWIARTALVTLPVNNTGRLMLKGYIPDKIFHKIYKGKIRIKVFNDSCLFKKNAPISRNYQQWIIEWLTEHWHSRFEINAETWNMFKAKVSAILNEALLSAKFVELGHTIQSYGSRKYY